MSSWENLINIDNFEIDYESDGEGINLEELSEGVTSYEVTASLALYFSVLCPNCRGRLIYESNVLEEIPIVGVYNASGLIEHLVKLALAEADIDHLDSIGLCEECKREEEKEDVSVLTTISEHF